MDSQSDYLEINTRYYDKQYASGYGVAYPESHVIRIYHGVLKQEFGLTGENGETLLDFGCGTGTHAEFFRSLGFAVYGVDTDSRAIAQCVRRDQYHPERYQVVDPHPDSNPFFGMQFDVIFSNQAMYYLSEADLGILLDKLQRQLKPGGVFISSMMSRKHHYYQLSEPVGDGMRRVVRHKALSNQAPATFYINFTESEEDLVDKFNVFDVAHVCFYDSVIREDLGSGHHYVFIGKKRTA